MNEPVRPDWDELMLTMDVADTLGHRQAEPEQLADNESDSQAVAEEVRRIYQAQGIEVSEDLVLDALEAARTERFSYMPPPDGWKRDLAHAWIDRGKWARRGGIALLVLAIAGITVAYW